MLSTVQAHSQAVESVHLSAVAGLLSALSQHPFAAAGHPFAVSQHLSVAAGLLSAGLCLQL